MFELLTVKSWFKIDGIRIHSSLHPLQYYLL